MSADVDQVQAQAAATLDQFTSTAKATRLPDPALWFARVAGDLNATTIPHHIMSAILAEALCRIADPAYHATLEEPQ